MTDDKKYTPPRYLKKRGYRHLTGKVDTSCLEKTKEKPEETGAARDERFAKRLSNTKYIAQYNFFPLLKYIKIENKYKKQNNKEEEQKGQMVFVYKDDATPLRKNEPKERPIEYPTHQDALIYAFCAQELLAPMYEHLLSLNQTLHKSVIGYRKISEKNQNNDTKYNKSTIHFSKDVFEHIQKLGECHILTFDIKNFFPSLDHLYLRKALLKLLQEYAEQPKDITENAEELENKKYERLHQKLNEWKPYLDKNNLPPDLYKVYKAVTKYAYIMLHDLKRTDGKKGFDEARLAKIRARGIEAYFESPQEMRKYITENKVVINKNTKSGIPHGLPISAYLANIYMCEFDKSIIEKLKEINTSCFYRRYSDDMIVVFPKQVGYKEQIKDFFDIEIKKIGLAISPHKTEFFWTQKNELGFLRTYRDIAFQVGACSANIQHKQQRYPITYLGLEFHGECEAPKKAGKQLDVRLKNASIQRFYRRMDMAISRQVRRAFLKQDKDLTPKPIIFRRRLYRLFSTRGVNRKYRDIPKIEGGEPKNKIIPKRVKLLRYNKTARRFSFEHKNESMAHRGNAITFAKRCDDIFFGGRQVIFRQYRKANKLLEKRIVYWIEQYKT